MYIVLQCGIYTPSVSTISIGAINLLEFSLTLLLQLWILLPNGFTMKPTTHYFLYCFWNKPTSPLIYVLVLQQVQLLYHGLLEYRLTISAYFYSNHWHYNEPSCSPTGSLMAFSVFQVMVGSTLHYTLCSLSS